MHATGCGNRLLSILFDSVPTGASNIGADHHDRCEGCHRELRASCTEHRDQDPMPNRLGSVSNSELLGVRVLLHIADQVNLPIKELLLSMQARLFPERQVLVHIDRDPNKLH